MDLEGRIEESKSNDSLSVHPIRGQYGNIREQQRELFSYLEHKRKSVQNYMIDVSAGWVFYTPLMAVEEHFSGMSASEIFSSRAISATQGIFTTKPYTSFREFWAKYWQVDKKSSFLKKFAIDTSATLLFQIPLYSSILFFSGASIEEAEKAMPLGLCIGLGTGRMYGSFLDHWRKRMGGKKPLFEE